MSERFNIRVSLGEDGKSVLRELFHDGVKVAEISYIETLELAMNCTSALRYERPFVDLHGARKTR